QNRQAKLIDFQGMRPGLAEYDLASLLFDPYVDLSGAERSELISYYRQKQADNGRTIDQQLDNTLQLCAMQRLMQALGAYGFLGLVRGHEHFLRYVPRAMRSLREIVAKIEDLKPLASLLADLGYSDLTFNRAAASDAPPGQQQHSCDAPFQSSSAARAQGARSRHRRGEIFC